MSYSGAQVRIETTQKGFPDGSVVKNLPTYAGDSASIPGPGRPYMPGGNYTPAP